MKLIVKLVDAPAVGGGRAYVLCDENGEMLPGQTSVVIESRVKDAPRLTVSFIVDGDEVRFS